jgi:hypothetical protein
MNLGRLGGWLDGEAWRSAAGKVAHSQSWAFGSWSRFARACHSLQKQVAPRFKNSPLLKRQKIQFIFFQSRLTNARSNLRSLACHAFDPGPGPSGRADDGPEQHRCGDDPNAAGRRGPAAEQHPVSRKLTAAEIYPHTYWSRSGWRQCTHRRPSNTTCWVARAAPHAIRHSHGRRAAGRQRPRSRQLLRGRPRGPRGGGGTLSSGPS